MMIFPDDPFTKAIAADNWAYAKPLVEHRDENNLHDVFSPVERSHGLYLMAEDIVRRELGAAWECEKNLARKKKRAA